MSITVFEAMQLPIMKKASLVAGHGGLNTPIKWVTIVEVIEDTTRLQEGEFLITTAYNLAQDYQRQDVFIEELAKQKISALAILTGFYLHSIPRKFIEAANHYQLPLFQFPPDINFSMITKEILQQIVSRQFERMSYSEKDFLEELLQNKISSKQVTIEKAKAFGIDLTAPYTFIKISFTDWKDENLKKQMNISLINSLQDAGYKFLVTHRYDSLLMLIQLEDLTGRIGGVIIEKIKAALKKQAITFPIKIGVGKSYSDPSFLVDSAKQAELAIKYSSLLFYENVITYYDELVPYELFINLKEQGINFSTYYQPVLGKLLTHDAKHNSDLLYTLEMFFYQNMNIQKTSTELFIHRHTLKYRLDKITDLTGIDVFNHDQRLHIQIALICYKLDRIL